MIISSWGDIMKTYTDRIRELREDNDLKQKDICEIMHSFAERIHSNA